MKYRRSLPAANFLGAALLFFASAGAITVLCQEAVKKDLPPASNTRTVGQNPEGISFTIRLKDGKAQFRQGEVIRVELLFSSSLPHTYRLDSATYDRSGRLEADTFHLSPRAGTVDPLRDYFQSGLYGFMGGGLRGMPELDVKPYIITEELNEWFRFDQPGKYKLYVTNKRVSKIPPDERRTFSENEITVTSNTIEFEILQADSKWSNQKLQEVTALLDASTNEEDRRAACRVLRFLNSAAAAKEMIRRFKGTDPSCDFEYNFGLLGSPHRALIIKEMEDSIGATQHPVTLSFIHTLALLKYTLDHPQFMPPYPSGDKEREKLWQDEMQKRRAAYNQLISDNIERLAVAISGKQKEALAISLNTLVDYKDGFPRSGRMAGDISDEQLSSALVNVFSDLPADRQYTILSYRWRQIARPELLPLLRKIYEKPGQTSWDLRDIALQRIIELAPDEGRRLILNEIQSGRPRVKARVLGLLPEETLPELDETLAAQLERLNSDDQYDVVSTYGDLIARYATSSILSRIKELYAGKIGRMACAIQTPLLMYFLRVDPAYGAEALEQALAARKDTGCYRSQFSDLTRAYWHPEIEKIALAHLNDANHEVMAQAADVLGKYGSATAEQPLWNTFEAWHERYAGREEALRADMKKANAIVEPMMIELSLVHSLSSARAWLTSADKLKRLRQLCVTEQCREEVASILRQSDSRFITVFFNPADDSIQYISLAQYQLPSVSVLKEKLAQFPGGTTFTWSSGNVAENVGEQLFMELQAHLKENGMKLEKFSPAK